MPVLFDPTDEFVSSVLDRAKREGEISLPDLEAIVEGGIEAAGCIRPDDIADTIEALARMGIEITDDLTQEQHDEEMHCAMKSWVDQGNMLPSLTGAAWASLLRVDDAGSAASRSPHPRRSQSGEQSSARGPGFRRCSPTSGLGFSESDEAIGSPEPDRALFTD